MFGKRINLFKLMGFQVRIDLSWIIIAILITWSLAAGLFPFKYQGLSTHEYWFMGILGALGLFLSIITHEFSHSVVARRYGIHMKGITLFIFGGVAEMGDEPSSPKAEFMMAIAGPIASIIIMIIFYASYLLCTKMGVPQTITGVIWYLAAINGLLVIFNLIPAFPLDGGRVLRSVLWALKDNIQWATRVSSFIGSAFGIFLIIMGLINFISGNFIGGMWMFLIGMFLQNAAKMSYQQLIIRKSFEGESVKRFMNSNPVTVMPDVSIDKFIEDYVYEYHYKMFPVVENSDKVTGWVTTKQIKKVPREEWNKKTVGEISEPCSPENTIEPDTDAMKALSIMNKSGVSRLMVVKGGRLAGIISLKDMLEFLSLKIELSE